MKWDFIDDYDENQLGYDLSDLTMDQFFLDINLNSSHLEEIYLYTLNEDCYKCPFLLSHHGNHTNTGLVTKDPPHNIFKTNTKFRIASEYKEYFPQEQTDNVICDFSSNFDQFGIYKVDVNESGCYMNILKEPVNIYSPILTVILLYVALYLLVYCIFRLWRKCIPKVVEPDKKAPKKRVQSLDTFRGLTIVTMIFANFGCGGYGIIEHAKWNGLHLADLVFPSFVWIMGVCIPISLSSSFKRNVPNKTLIFNITKRSIKLFCLGIFLNSGADLNYLRLFGVLQRFSIAYFVVSIVCIYSMDRSQEQPEQGIFADIMRIWKGWVVVISLLLTHTAVIFTVAAPKCPRGYMGPGGLHENLSHKNCIGGATGYIDGLILGNHRYQNPTIYSVYEAKPFDPEGIVGCLTTIFHTFIGVQAGTTLLVYKSHSQRLLRWFMWAVVTGVIGGCLCGFRKEDGLIPVNKNLWSSSFVMVTSCFAFFLLSICYVLIDVKNWWSGKPFLFAGMNAILMYIGHEMTDGHFPVRWYLHNNSAITTDPRRTHFIALLSDLWGVGIWVFISFYLHEKGVFFTI
ncbi:heparan-alpha-glucosaminide N-acetyltransferase [Leptinotarsa decemlineata]|uniref:heparan-alpha-glucosaminide N-acetyltransferase n=1 Tax=Leptinotarsa decemlineata TaxID=7539 RepID=UPI003D30A850